MENLLSFDIGDQFIVNKSGQGIKSALGFQEGIGGIISTLINNVYILAGIVLFILLIVGGLGFIMGAGSDNPEQAKKSKSAITSALIGFVVIFCSYWIIRIIEILTGFYILDPSKNI
jgi:Zn-dependent protease with chaperone function